MAEVAPLTFERFADMASLYDLATALDDSEPLRNSLRLQGDALAKLHKIYPDFQARYARLLGMAIDATAASGPSDPGLLYDRARVWMSDRNFSDEDL